MTLINKEVVLNPTIRILSGVVLIGTLLMLFKSAASHYQTNQEIKKQSVCPALLSISRSARDTLIVMKAERLCNEFVIENLK